MEELVLENDILKAVFDEKTGALTVKMIEAARRKDFKKYV